MLYDTQAHKAKCLAKVAASQLAEKREANVEQTANTAMRLAQAFSTQSNQKDVLLAALEQDRLALKQHTDVKKKIALKKEQLIPKWTPLIEQYRDSGAHHPFEPLVWFAIWLIDAEYIDKGIYWADFSIQQNQKMPDSFKSSNLESVIARQVHDWALIQFKASHSAEPYLSQVAERIENNRWLVSEPTLLGMLFKLVAMYAEQEKLLEKAETYYLKAVAANEKHGVKGHLHRVQKLLNKPLTELK